MSHYKNLVKLLMSVARQYGTWEVFKDFIEMTAIAYSNAVDCSFNRKLREDQYMEIVKRYDKKDLNRFPEMLAELTFAMEENPCDILGRIYCELELANKWGGQFFTPDSVSRLMGQILTAGMKKIIEEKGFVTVQEPAIGGGALIINLALAMQEEKINYQQSMLVTGIDVDIKAIHMAYIQLTLLHIPAILVHGNSLSMEVHSKWYTPAYIMGGWQFRRQREKETQGQVIELKTSTTESVVNVEPVKIEKYEAMSLFG